MRSIATRSQLRAYAQSFSAVEVETPSAAAACSAVRPAKNRSLTSSALRGSSASSCRRASSRASKRSPFSSSRAGSMSSRSSRRRPPPALLGLLVPGPVDQDTAHGLGGGGEEVPAAVPVLRSAPRPTSRRYASCTSAVACKVWPGCSWANCCGGQPAQLVVDQRQQLLGGAFGSPCSMAERIWVTSFIATAPVGRPGRVSGPTPSDVARPIAPGPVSETGRHQFRISPDRRRGQPGLPPRWRRGRLEGLADGTMGIVYQAR